MLFLEPKLPPLFEFLMSLFCYRKYLRIRQFGTNPTPNKLKEKVKIKIQTQTQKKDHIRCLMAITKYMVILNFT
jgi:hypothetical protein